MCESAFPDIFIIRGMGNVHWETCHFCMCGGGSGCKVPPKCLLRQSLSRTPHPLPLSLWLSESDLKHTHTHERARTHTYTGDFETASRDPLWMRDSNLNTLTHAHTHTHPHWHIHGGYETASSRLVMRLLVMVSDVLVFYTGVLSAAEALDPQPTIEILALNGGSGESSDRQPP